jgi:hypothetical protein
LNSLNRYHFCIYLHVYTLFVPPSLPRSDHTLPTPTPTLSFSSRQNLFCPPVLQFYRRKSIKNNKKNMELLLAWDKDSYIGRFLVLFPCVYVLQSKFVHLYQSSLLLPSLLPIVALASVRLRYSFLYSEHINHIQVLISFPCPIFPMQSSLTEISVQLYYCICFSSTIHVWGRIYDFWPSEPD